MTQICTKNHDGDDTYYQLFKLDSLKRNKWRLVVVIMLLIIIVAVGRQYYKHNQLAEQELQRYIKDLRDEGIFILKRSLADLSKVNVSDTVSYNDFLDRAKKENVSIVYLDKMECTLYFLSSPIERSTEIIRFYYMASTFDWGGVWSLSLTALIVILSKLDLSIMKNLMKSNIDRCAIILILASTGLIGIWLTTRTIVLHCYNYIFLEGFPYKPSNVFAILAYLVTANLSFTLLKALRVQRPTDGQSGNNDDGATLKGLIEVVIQADMIGIITLIPSYGQEELLVTIGGSIGFVLIFATMVIALFVLIYAREHLIRKQSKLTYSR